ncbi:MAG TPA: cell division protein ZapA [Acidobacteriota bacterium]|nr:cell division protein ZapA [Acidobacteriota bacterium]
MQDGNNAVTAVKIYGQTYHVRSGDPEHVRRLAHLVDEQMKEVSRQTPTVDSLKVAVLAALNLADRQLSARREVESLREQVQRESNRMTARLDAARDL